MTHAEAQRIHTVRNFRFRHKLNITNAEYMDMICQIQSARSLFTGKYTKNKTTHIVELRNQLHLVGYDKKTKQITTVLPEKRFRKVYNRFYKEAI